MRLRASEPGVGVRFFVPLENFQSYGDVTITSEGLQILNCARHSWPLGSEGSFAFHTYCDMGHPFYNGHFRGPVILTSIARYFAVELSLPVFRLRSVAAKTPHIPLSRRTL